VGKPRQREPDPLPLDQIDALEKELLVRREARGDRWKAPPEHTLEAIAWRMKAPFNYDRVRQGEGLLAVGWDLRKSHPDFSVNDGAVRWPSVKKAASILASESAG
jgi:hypothetical protein